MELRNVENIVGIDVGGTFTDLYYADDEGCRTTTKVPSNPRDPSAALIHALQASDVDPAATALIVHGTTIATNAIIERKGARAALITTRGFRDILELGRRDRPTMYGLGGVQQPLIPRDLRFEVDERLDARGEVLRPLHRDEVLALGTALANEGIEAVVVCFLHAYANPAHEQAAARWLAELDAGFEIVTSHSVCNEYFEFERTSTAAIQGFLQPLVAGYARRLRERLDEGGYRSEALIMQSSGGVVPLDQVAARAANIVRSGPAAGVMAATRLAGEAGFDNIITGDMGGTSFDVAVVVDGTPKVARASRLDFRVILKLPMIDVHTIGAGGGSIAGLDGAGILQVGPESAGADPGPACYGRGGTAPTVTDANVVLGRIDWARPIGAGDQEALDLEAARAAIGDLGKCLDLGVEETAEAILRVVNHTMAGRTRLLSIEQGLDPRDFTFVCFGGAGPLHGAAIMRDVGISRLLVPPEPGVLCATGCCIADIRHDVSRTVERPLGELGDGELDDMLDELRRTGEAHLTASRQQDVTPDVSYTADLCYFGQIHNLRVAIERGWSAERLGGAFEAAYRAEFGNTLADVPATLVSVQAVVSAPPPGRVVRSPGDVVARPATPARRRPVHFGAWLDTAIYDRRALEPGMSFAGPAVVEQADTTTIVEPGMRASVDGFGNLQVEANS